VRGVRLVTPAEVFIDAVRECVDAADEGHGEHVSFVAGRALDERSPVVLYREHPRGPVLGRRFDLDELARLFRPVVDPRVLAEIMCDNELFDPTGHGEVLDVDWADGLGLSRREVEWVGASPWLPDARELPAATGKLVPPAPAPDR
jgi:hypothetical protein